APPGLDTRPPAWPTEAAATHRVAPSPRTYSLGVTSPRVISCWSCVVEKDPNICMLRPIYQLLIMAAVPPRGLSDGTASGRGRARGKGECQRRFPPIHPSALDQTSDHLAADVGQAHVASLVAEGQARVVQPEQVQDGRVQVVDGHQILD